MITQKILKESLSYNKETGVFRWKEQRPLSHFKNHVGMLVWHRICSGKIAGNKSAKGYIRIRVCVRSYNAHHLAWLYVNGYLPKQIDHINGIRDDNRICNLREADQSINTKNCALSRRNKSGVIGVNFHKESNKWHSRISDNNKRISLGYFDDFFEAICARKSAENKHGYHHNHGRKKAAC